MKLKEFRQQLGLSQLKMAEKIGVSESFYSKIENGIKNPSFNFITKFKAVFPDVNVDELFFEGGEGMEKKSMKEI